ncbi:hypothetical protein [Streptomyces sp. NPDC053720]|uniref:hypothetical protein n=1 Tax=Streptomyces sp. NPDC053720 TaxID=3154855 RepID=UPI0034321D74
MSSDRAPEHQRPDATVQPSTYRPAYEATPHYRMPLAYETPAAVPGTPYGERPAVVWVPDAYGQMVPMPKHLAPAPMEPTQPRDLTPQPLLDPRAQVLAAGGVFAAGTGWGIGQMLAPIAGLGAGGLMWLAIAIVGFKLVPAASRGAASITHHHTTNVTNNNRGFGRSRSTIKH